MKKIILFILFFLLIISGYFFYQNQLHSKKSIVKQENIIVYLKLDGQEDFVKQAISTKKNALEFTKEKTKLVTKGEGAYAYVVEINGRKANDLNKEFWAFYLNGRQAEVGAGSYQLKEGDKIEWKLEKY
jgi:hypothetical protein